MYKKGLNVFCFVFLLLNTSYSQKEGLGHSFNRIPRKKLLIKEKVIEQNQDSILQLARRIGNKKDSLLQRIEKANVVNSKLQLYQDTLNKTLTKIIAKKDSLVLDLKEIPEKFIKGLDNKIEKYSGRVTKKTEKTLERLSRWEGKIKNILQKTSPETAQRLFSNEQLTFSGMLQKLKAGEQLTKQYHVQYDAYRDKLSSSLKYLDQQKESLDKKMIKPLSDVRTKLTDLGEKTDNAEVIRKLIKERKRDLMNAAFQYIGKSRYFDKINKETWYYAETMKNYKEIFNEPDKAEETAKTILNKIPLFQKFVKENSMLASIFGTNSIQSGASGIGPISGFQTRESIQQALKGSLLAGSPNTQQLISQNVEKAQSELAGLKDNILSKVGGSSTGGEMAMPDFKPNLQKTKTFFQRIEYSTDIQFAKNNNVLPTTTDIALSIGYKLNNKSVVGIGASYKMGLGSIEHIQITHQGLGMRSFLDWKLKKQFFISGGFELNYNAQFKSIDALKNSSYWQQSALVGVTKKLKIKTKCFKATKLQLMFDIMSRQHIPVSQPVLFRVGYSF